MSITRKDIFAQRECPSDILIDMYCSAFSGTQVAWIIGENSQLVVNLKDSTGHYLVKNTMLNINPASLKGIVKEVINNINPFVNNVETMELFGNALSKKLHSMAEPTLLGVPVYYKASHDGVTLLAKSDIDNGFDLSGYETISPSIGWW